MEESFDVEKFVCFPETKLPATPSHKKGRKFVKPIDLEWIQTAANLPGKALHVALGIWYLAGLKKTNTIRLSSSVLKGFGASRQAGYRNLEALKDAGLISIERHQGRNPIVTIIEVGD